MEPINEKYNKALELLKRNTPALSSTGEITEKVLDSLPGRHVDAGERFDPVEFFFGWTKINWVRRSLVAASVVLIIIFVVQQSMMMKQINRLSSRVESYERGPSAGTGELIEKRMMFLRFSGKKLPFLKKSNPDKQVDELFRTIDQLKREYKDLDNMINENPELKKQIEEKLSEISGSKIKL